MITFLVTEFSESSAPGWFAVVLIGWLLLAVGMATVIALTARVRDRQVPSDGADELERAA